MRETHKKGGVQYWLQCGDGKGCRLGVGMYASFNGSLGSGCDEQRVAVVQIHLLDACDDALRRTLVAGSVCERWWPWRFTTEEALGRSRRCCQPLPHVVQDKLELRNRDGPQCRVGNHTPDDSYANV